MTHPQKRMFLGSQIPSDEKQFCYREILCKRGEGGERLPGKIVELCLKHIMFVCPPALFLALSLSLFAKASCIFIFFAEPEIVAPTY